MASGTLHLWVCSVTLFDFALGVHQMWNHKVDIIRIHNNGTQVRTIFLPKLLYSSDLDTANVSGSYSTNTIFDKNSVSTHKAKNHSQLDFDYEVKGIGNKQILGKNKDIIYTKYTKPFNKIHDHNSTISHPTHSFTNDWKKDASANRSFPIELKLSASKIAKLLNLFTIVNFTNNDCYLEGQVGTCFHADECKSLGGQPLGLCAQGYGVCCYMERTCGESSMTINTHMNTAAIDLEPQTGVYICTVTIYKASPHVRQLRLSFLDFQLAGPVNGNCAVDRFVVTGQNKNDIIPPICGSNTGKHIYVDVDETTGPVSLTLLSSGAYGVPRNFKVQVTQVKKDDPLLAPNNCLQYYTEPRGNIESFNYSPFNDTSSVVPGYFNNLNYAICFKKNDDFCGIVYSNIAAGGMEFNFELVNKEADGTDTVPEGQAGAEKFDCPDDYIIISGTRLCGYKLNDGSVMVNFLNNYPVTDNTDGPLLLQFHTNNNYTGRGFHLEYQLIKCSTPPQLSTQPSSSPTPPTTSSNPLSPPAATRTAYVQVNLLDS